MVIHFTDHSKFEKGAILKAQITILSLCALLFLPACETLNSQADSPMTPMEMESENAAMNDYINPAPMRPVMPVLNSLPSYDGGIVTKDPSVTIFPLDGQNAIESSYYNSASPVTPYAPAFDGGTGYTPSFTSSDTPTMGGDNNNTLYFVHGSARLGSGDQRRLMDAAQEAKFAPVDHITISGYASRPTQAGEDGVQADIINLKQSMNRSFAVSKQMIENGVPAEKIKTVSWGAARASGTDSQDRRVNIMMGAQ